MGGLFSRLFPPTEDSYIDNAEPVKEVKVVQISKWHTPFIQVGDLKGMLMFGKYPSTTKLNILKACGITVFVDLTEEGEEKHGSLLMPYNITGKIALPIEEKYIPDDVTAFNAIIDNICKCLEEGKNVYVHCKNGRGRSGMVAAIILGRGAGISYEDTLDIINSAHRMGHGSSSHWDNVIIPPHSLQRRFVREYIRRIKT